MLLNGTKKNFLSLLIRNTQSLFYKGDEQRATNEGGWPFDQPFYLILNIALGGWWGAQIDDSIFPVSMQFKYVRVYERSE